MVNFWASSFLNGDAQNHVRIVLAFSFQLSGVSVCLVTDSPILFQLCLEYFRYYNPVQTNPSNQFQIKIKLLLREEHSLEISKPARHVSKIGVVELRRYAKRLHQWFYYRTDTALFRINPESGHAVGIVNTKALELPNLLVNTYLFSTLLLLLRFQDVYHLHAAAVISPENKVYLICGAQRAGKSTLTAAFGVAGWKPISDDGILLRRDEKGNAQFEAFKREFHVSTELLNKWEGLHGLDSRHDYFDRSCIDGLNYFSSVELANQSYEKFDAVIFPTISGEEKSSLESISPSEAIKKMIGQSMYFPLGIKRIKPHFEVLTELCGSANFYRFLAGKDVWDDPRNLLPICEELS